MRRPWANKTGLSRLIAIFTTSVLVSAGLCGVNLIGWLGLYQLNTVQSVLATILTYLGVVEAVVLALSLITLLFLFIVHLLERPKQAP